MRVWSLGWEDPLEEGMATHSSTLAWRIQCTEEPVRLQSIGSQRVRHDWSNLACTYARAVRSCPWDSNNLAPWSSRYQRFQPLLEIYRARENEVRSFILPASSLPVLQVGYIPLPKGPQLLQGVLSQKLSLGKCSLLPLLQAWER